MLLGALQAAVVQCQMSLAQPLAGWVQGTQATQFVPSPGGTFDRKQSPSQVLLVCRKCYLAAGIANTGCALCAPVCNASCLVTLFTAQQCCWLVVVVTTLPTLSILHSSLQGLRVVTWPTLRVCMDGYVPRVGRKCPMWRACNLVLHTVRCILLLFIKFQGNGVDVARVSVTDISDIEAQYLSHWPGCVMASCLDGLRLATSHVWSPREQPPSIGSEHYIAFS